MNYKEAQRISNAKNIEKSISDGVCDILDFYRISWCIGTRKNERELNISKMKFLFAGSNLRFYSKKINHPIKINHVHLLL